MSTNNFRTQLPQSLDGLPKLELIEAAHQYLQGPLPAWSDLPAIRAIYIPDIRGPEEKTLGEIPDSWGNFDTMQVFSVHNYHTHRRFSGTLPDGMNEWSSLANFQIQRNDFSGELPLGVQEDLRYFTISSNDFSGEFPWDSIFNGKNAALSKFDINWNDFSGELPQTVPPALEPQYLDWDTYRLAHFSAMGNSLSGPLPHWIPEFRGLQILNVGGNDFSGPFPAALLNQSRLKTLYLNGNNLSGPLPDAPWSTNRIRWFYINGNNFEGEIPDSWQTLFQEDDGTWIDAAFQRYLFHDNEFTGRIPDWASNVDWGSRRMHTFDNNKYTFADITGSYDALKASVGEGFRVAPQKPFGNAQTYDVNVGSSLTLDDFNTDVTHADNAYQWHQDGNPISGATSRELTISSAQASDAREYTLQVTNPNVPELTLTSEPITVTVS